MIRTKEFPITIEMLYTVRDRDKYFIRGKHYQAIGLIHRILNCDDCEIELKRMEGKAVLFYVLLEDEKEYAVPALSASPAHKGSWKGLFTREQYWITKSEGDIGITDHVKAAKDIYGVDIRSKIDIAHSNFLSKYQRPVVADPVDVLVKEDPVVDMVEQYAQVEPLRVFISIYSAAMQRGNVVEYSLALNRAPVEPVTITISDDCQALSYTPQLIFDASNYDIEQTVEVTLKEDYPFIVKPIVGTITHKGDQELSNTNISKISILIRADR